MPNREKAEAMAEPRAGDRWRKLHSNRTVTNFKRWHSGTPLTVSYIVTSSTNRGNICYHPTLDTFRRWAANATFLGGGE